MQDLEANPGRPHLPSGRLTQREFLKGNQNRCKKMEKGLGLVKKNRHGVGPQENENVHREMSQRVNSRCCGGELRRGDAGDLRRGVFLTDHSERFSALKSAVGG